MRKIGRGFEYFISDGTKRVATCTKIEFHEGLRKPLFTGISPHGNKIRLTREEIHRFI